jgi:hypothetical protein
MPRIMKTLASLICFVGSYANLGQLADYFLIVSGVLPHGVCVGIWISPNMFLLSFYVGSLILFKNFLVITMMQPNTGSTCEQKPWMLF